MKTIFIGIPEQYKGIAREFALKDYYSDQKHLSGINSYVDQPEGYFLVRSMQGESLGELRFYQSPGQSEPYKVEYYRPIPVYPSGAVVMKVSHEPWVMAIWDKFKDPDSLRNYTLKRKKDGK